MKNKEENLVIITKKQAIKLKELGFNWDIEDDCYSLKDEELYEYELFRHRYPDGSGYLAAPTVLLAIKWLRNEHGIYVSTPIDTRDNVVNVEIYDVNGTKETLYFEEISGNTEIEKAELIGLDYGLDYLLKHKIIECEACKFAITDEYLDLDKFGDPCGECGRSIYARIVLQDAIENTKIK